MVFVYIILYTNNTFLWIILKTRCLELFLIGFDPAVPHILHLPDPEPEVGVERSTYIYLLFLQFVFDRCQVSTTESRQNGNEKSVFDFYDDKAREEDHNKHQIELIDKKVNIIPIIFFSLIFCFFSLQSISCFASIISKSTCTF